LPFERHCLHEPGLAQMAEVALTRVGGTTAMIAKVTSRHDPKRPDCGNRSALRAAKAVLAIANVDARPRVATRQVEPLSEDVARIDWTKLARIAAGATPPTDVGSIAVVLPRVVAPPRIVEVEHGHSPLGSPRSAW